MPLIIDPARGQLAALLATYSDEAIGAHIRRDIADLAALVADKTREAERIRSDRDLSEAGRARRIDSFVADVRRSATVQAWRHRAEQATKRRDELRSSMLPGRAAPVTNLQELATFLVARDEARDLVAQLGKDSTALLDAFMTAIEENDSTTLLAYPYARRHLTAEHRRILEEQFVGASPKSGELAEVSFEAEIKSAVVSAVDADLDAIAAGTLTVS